jgi:hypothetical protein
MILIYQQEFQRAITQGSIFCRTKQLSSLLPAFNKAVSWEKAQDRVGNNAGEARLLPFAAGRMRPHFIASTFLRRNNIKRTHAAGNHICKADGTAGNVYYRESQTNRQPQEAFYIK